MPIEVSCPACGTRLKAPDSKAGKKARCGKCHEKVRIPGTPPMADTGGESHMRSPLSTPMPGMPDQDDETVPMADSVEDDYDPLPLPIPPAGENKSATRTPDTPLPPSPSNPGRPAFGSGGKLPPVPDSPPSAASAPSRPESKSKPKAPAIDSPTTPPPSAKDKKPAKDKKAAKSEPKKPGLDAPKPPASPASPPTSPPAQEVLSLDDDPAPASPPAAPSPPPAASSGSQPFAFVTDLAPTPKGASKAKQKALEKDDKPSARSKSKQKPEKPEKPATTQKTDEPEEPGSTSRYVRPSEQKSSKTLLFASLFGLAALATAIVAVIVFVNKSKTPPPEAKPAEKKEEPASQAPPVEPPKDDKNAKNDSPKKEGDPAKSDQKARTPGAAGPTVAMLALPGNARTIQFRPLGDKPERIDQPHGIPIPVEASFDKVKRFFAPHKRVDQDAVVVWQSNAGFNGKGERLAVDSYSGTTGARVGRFEFDSDGKEPRCDVSGTGGLFAAVGPDGTITVWNLADATKVLESFDPYAELPEQKKAGLAAVFFPQNPKHLVTVSTAGAVHIFDIASKKQLGEFIPPNGVPGRVVLGKNVSIDEARVSVVVAVGGAIYQVATIAPLSLVWKLELGGDVGRAFGLASIGSPGRIVYAFETDANKKKEKAVLFCFPNEKPIVYKWPDQAGDPVGVGWSDTAIAMLASTRGAIWVEATAKSFTPLAMAEVPGGKALHATTETAHWYLIPNPADATKSLLLELSMPPQGLIDYRKAAEARQSLFTLRLDDKGLWR